jgi:ABC-type lipoprotein export system ATPase subunit
VNHERELGKKADRTIWIEDGKIKDRDADLENI